MSLATSNWSHSLRLVVSGETFLLGLQQAVLIPYLTLYGVLNLNLSPAGVAFFLLAFHSTGFASSLYLPSVSDRRRSTLGIFRFATVMAIVGFTLLALSRTPILSFVAVLLFAGPASCQNSLFFAAVRGSSGRASGVIASRGIFTVAWVVGPLVGTYIVSSFGYPGLFGTLVLINVVLLASSFIVRPTGAAIALKNLASNQPVKAWYIAGLFVAIVLILLSNVIATTTMPVIVINELHQPPAYVGAAFAACALFETLLFLLLARFISRLNPTLTLLLACAAGLLYYLILGSSTSGFVVVAAQVLNALLMAPVVGIGMTWFQALIPSRLGLATGLFLNSTRVASLLAAPLLGLIASRAGAYQPTSYVAATVVALGAGLLVVMRPLAVAGRDLSRFQ